MKLLKTILVGTALLALVACTKEKQQETTVVKEEVKEATVAAPEKPVDASQTVSGTEVSPEAQKGSVEPVEQSAELSTETDKK